MTIIRPARADEAPLLAALAERAYVRYVERIGRRPPPMDADFPTHIAAGQAFVLEDDGGIAGYVLLVHEPDHLLVENLAVEPERHGAGLGRTLLEFAERRALERGLPELRLYTHLAMTENQRMYPHLGYHETERRDQRAFYAKPVPGHPTSAGSASAASGSASAPSTGSPSRTQ